MQSNVQVKMKRFFLLTFLLLLTSCNVPPTTSVPVVHLSNRAVGYGLNTAWACEATDVTEGLVWVECEFLNQHLPIKNTCIRVTFNDTLSHQEIVQSRKVCSGPLWANRIAKNYAAFVKDQKKTLDAMCGIKLNKCYLDTKVETTSSQKEE